MWFRDVLIAQKEFLTREKSRIAQQLKDLPKGRLIKKKSRGKDYYYLETKGKRTSLFKNPKLRDKYLLRGSLQTQLYTIDKNITVLERAIKSYHPLVELTTMWATIEAQQNNYKEEHKVHVYRGVSYRSKSEMLIATILTSYGIEFKYESKMYVNGRYIYPDFVIKRPKDGKIFIWEHFGKMQEDDYRRKNINRIEEFHQVGYYLWDNFIASFDLGKNSINMDYIDKIIKLYLL